MQKLTIKTDVSVSSWRHYQIFIDKNLKTQILKPNFVVNVHEIGGVFYNPPTPDKVGPLQTSLLLTVS